MNFLAWGARGRRFKSSHPDSFFLVDYDEHIRKKLYPDSS
jgi:hypothetical protein